MHEQRRTGSEIKLDKKSLDAHEASKRPPATVRQELGQTGADEAL